MNQVLKHAAEWTDDCQGKKDYDAEFVSVSTRYWPGYQTVFNSHQPWKGLHKIATGGPSAKSSILLRTDDEMEPLVLVERDFEATTEEEVKARVETWVDVQFAKIVKALRHEFKV